MVPLLGVSASLLGPTGTADARSPSVTPPPEASESSESDRDEAPALDDAPQLRPPELLEFAEAVYPEQAIVDGRDGNVVLALTLDAEGRVTRAEVVQSMGDDLDAAARDASMQFRFSPALRDGVPVPARILYTYEFRLPDAPPVGSIAGRVFLPGSDTTPAVGVEVVLTAPTGETFVTRTDAEGAFEVPDLPPGTYRLRTDAPGLGTATLSLSVSPGETTATTLRLLAGRDAQPIEVTVQGPSEADRLRRSAQAVNVVETEDAKRQTADLGEVLARSQGIGVRRGGGLGSSTRFSLNGLTDDQVRFFLDGVPLEFAGYPFGIANVPVNLVDRVEVYRGVVPIRFGADALGGAVNVVTDEEVEGTHGSASYQAGSFGTHRLTLGARTLHEPSGFFSRIGGFFDTADNDYEIDVEVPDDRGRLTPARVHRFHDAYRAGGGNVEFGFVDRPWAKRLLARAFVSDFRKELQHNVVMTVPYGEVEYGELTAGGSLRYEQVFRDRFTLSMIGGYAYGRATFRDVGECVYDWFGQCVRERVQPGEIETRPRDQVQWDHSGFGRLNFGWQIHPQHAVRLSVAPSYTTRTGDERRQADPEARDPLSAQRDLFTMVTGAEYQIDVFGDRLQNVLFVKNYVQVARSEEPLPGEGLRRRDRNSISSGLGDALRVRILDWLWAKASYEYATRLPRPDEVFGDGALVLDDLELRPETSHNANLGATLESAMTRAGSWRGDLNGFVREADQLIVLLGNDRVFTYQNVFGARSTGLEAAAGWTSPGEYVLLDGNVTYMDFRNTSDDGTFADFEGDRIPNRPYLFANGTGRVQFRGVAAPKDEIALVWNTRYVHGFFRGWESVGLTEFKQTVPAQILHSLALTYLIRRDPITLSFAGELQNITNAEAFDFFGVQRPGRAFYFKTTLEF